MYGSKIVDIFILIQCSKRRVSHRGLDFFHFPFAGLSHLVLLFIASDRDNINLNIIRWNVRMCWVCVVHMSVLCTWIVCSSDKLQAHFLPPPANTQHSKQTNIHTRGEIRTGNPSKRASIDSAVTGIHVKAQCQKVFTDLTKDQS